MKERVVEWCEEEHLMYVVLMDEDEGAWSAWHGMAWRHSMKLDTYLGMTLFLSTHYIVVDIYFVPYLLTMESNEIYGFFGRHFTDGKGSFYIFRESTASCLRPVTLSASVAADPSALLAPLCEERRWTIGQSSVERRDGEEWHPCG